MNPITYDNLHDVETRTTDASTGGQKGVKLTRIGALDPIAIIEVARVAGFGAEKYEAFNYLRGYDWSKSFDAMQRHAMLFWAGEDIDVESGRPHIAMAAWHAMALLSFMLRGLGTDNRPPGLGDVFSTLQQQLTDFPTGPADDLFFSPAEVRHERLLNDEPAYDPAVERDPADGPHMACHDCEPDDL